MGDVNYTGIVRGVDVKDSKKGKGRKKSLLEDD